MQAHLQTLRFLLCSSILLLASSFSPFSTHAEDQRSKQEQDKQPKGALIVPPTDRFGDVAPGAAEDTFKACLARIPERQQSGSVCWPNRPASEKKRSEGRIKAYEDSRDLWSL